jgi:carbon monoxide dehydrogenase subunit G
MELSGKRTLKVPREEAWHGLNDPAILCKSIAGCESLDRVGENEYAVVLAAAIGPVRARFRGKLRLEDVVAPSSYTLRFEGDGPAGFAKGTAHVTLSGEGDETLLEYQVSSQVGGKIAQVGSRLVDSVARKLAEEFFTAFEAQIARPAAIAPAPPAPADWASNPWIWAGIIAAGIVVLVVLRLALR